MRGCADNVGYGHGRWEAAAQAMGGGAEARDRGGCVCAGRIGFDGGAAVRRQCKPGLGVASALFQGRRAVAVFIHACERGVPKNRKAINWKLLTDLPVSSRAAAIEKLDWYAMRWKIETFHKVLKSGCRAEDAKLRTAERLTNLIAVYCIVSWRVFWLTMLARVAPQAPATLAFQEAELHLLDHVIKDTGKVARKKTLRSYLTKLARLGGYLARASDPPPGNMVMWRGLSRLTDIQIGAAIAAKSCG